MSELPYGVRPPRGERTPLLVSIPHTGTEVPDWLRPRLASAEHRWPQGDLQRR